MGFVAGLPIQAGGGHVAGPVRTAAGQEDQVTGEGLVLLDHDDVPNPELPALLPHQPAVLHEVHGALVHGVVRFVAQPVLVALLDGRDRDDEEQRETARHRARGRIDNQLDQKYDKKIKVGYSSELFK